MAYATDLDYAEHYGLSVADLPTNITPLLEEASAFLAYLTQGNRDDDDATHTEALRKATAAQVRAWLRTEAQVGAVKSEAIGSVRTEYVTSSEPTITRGVLAPEARAYLWPLGLLYRGVRLA